MHRKLSMGRVRCRMGLRGASRLLAVMLLVGLGVSALPGVSARMSLASVLGYAGFGYVPSNCGEQARWVQALNGERIHVCQHRDNATGAFFAGRRRGYLAWSGVSLTVRLPDRRLSFSCCRRATTPDGRLARFTPATFGPVGGLDPLSGTAQYAAVDGGVTYLTVVQTATLSRAAAGYHLDYAITNTSGVALAIRPLARVPYYSFADAPSWSTSPSPRAVTMRSGKLGGGLTIRGSSANGSPEVGGFTAGTDAAVAFAERPTGAFDNSLHPVGGAELSSGAAAALEWTDHATAPLAAGATAHYAVDVTLEETRDLRLSLSNPNVPPTAGAATAISASVYDERGSAGKSVRWQLSGGASGTAVVDGGGHASFAVPAFAGGRVVRAYLDTDGDGAQGAGEPDDSGYVWSPGVVAPPPLKPLTPVAVPVTPLSLKLRSLKAQRLKTVTRSGMLAAVFVDRAATVRLRLTVPSRLAKRLHLPKRSTLLAAATVKARKAGSVSIRLKLRRGVSRRLRHHTVVATLSATASDAAGQKTRASRSATIKG